MNWNEAYTLWQQNTNLPQDLQTDLQNATDLEDRFYKNLEFGTGGLRGIIGAGTNRMNVFTVNKATRGLGKYLLSNFKTPSCAIAYDSRNKSYEFAKTTAATLAEMGIKVYIYSRLMPTPMLSFATRYLKCDAGVVITASHNPAKYNGYKVYGADGCQVTLKSATSIQGYINAESLFTNALPLYEAFENTSIEIISKEVENAYYNSIMALQIAPCRQKLKVVYSPLNGTGLEPVIEIANRLQNISLTVVKEQEMPDGNFTTCPYPNPEIPQAVSLAASLCQKINADFFIATDPDCDRIGAGVPTDKGIRLINGNEMGILLFDYICKQKIKTNTMPKNPQAVKTIVTTEMANAVAKKYNVKLHNVLTGFKFIGEVIAQLESKNEENNFLFGFEESYGYLSSTAVRDKDAVNAALLIFEMAAYYKSQNKNLLQALNDLYSEYGFYSTLLLSFEFSGIKGEEIMQSILNSLRQKELKAFADMSIVKLTDYLKSETNLPKSNVISLSLDDEITVIVRPSGTEPKLKLYITASGACAEIAKQKIEKAQSNCNNWVNSFRQI